MAGHTRVNLRGVEDAAARHGMTGMQARFAGGPLGLERCGVSLQRLEPGVRQPFAHRHGEQEELYVVVAGGGRVTLDGEELELGAWDALRVAPEVVRCFEGGAEGMEFIAFGAPRTAAQDAEMMPPDGGRP